MILYLHGLNSAGTAGKAVTLQDALAPVPVISPTYPAHRPKQAITELSQLIRELILEHPRLMIIGSSVGGFYGQYLARQFPVFHLMMINPALKPWDLLHGVDSEQQNFITGERYLLTTEDVAQIRCFEIKDINDGVSTTIFLDKGDEDIDYRIAADIYGDSGKLYIFAGGNHRFQHMDEAIEIIRGGYADGVSGR
ncbi:hypothetical protein MNBD_GAMMA26-957 [hydrothermal vent metagenome]|uniref:Esterase YqiA n=1 Tax=hydrothermal vent metagenome TaxID=652676 RepID=A0A3B1AWQ9_9ZZZZ